MVREELKLSVFEMHDCLPTKWLKICKKNLVSEFIKIARLKINIQKSVFPYINVLVRLCVAVAKYLKETI
jgi:hypothetical protein